MLVELRVRNFVLIDSLDLDLSPGFNVLTGETGAGKSIVIGALSLVLGGRAAPDMVRRGSDEAEVEALFDLSALPEARARLAEAGLTGDEAVLRRIVSASGRSRAYLNGRLCALTELSALAPGLVDVSSQHASVALADPGTHLGYLDAFARLDKPRSELGVQVDALREQVRELRALEAAERGRAEREAFLRYQIGLIDDIAPEAGELATLGAERDRLRHAEKLGEITRGAADRLYDADPSLCDDLGRIGASLGAAAKLDGSLEPVHAAIEAARVELVEAGRQLARYAEALRGDPARLTDVEDRISNLTKLIRQHGTDLADVLLARERLEQDLTNLGEAESKRATLAAEIDRALDVASKRARELSRARREAASGLGTEIARELKSLGMGSARVVVDVAPLGGDEAELSVDGARLGRDGIDRVELLIAPNPGVEPRPLRKIASGGELSRSLLALKRVLAGTGPAGLYVFDEVDAGVGGAVAERIGEAIADVARHRQVLCITHLSPIAAFADRHFVVAKKERDGLASTTVEKLTDAKRPDEIARMLSGAKVTAAGRKAAEEMLRTASVKRGA